MKISRKKELELWFKQVWGTKPFKHNHKDISKYVCGSFEDCLICETNKNFEEFKTLPEDKEKVFPKKKIKHKKDLPFEEAKRNYRKAELFKRQQKAKKEGK